MKKGNRFFNNYLTFLSAVLVLFTVLNVIPNIFDPYRNSMILSCGYASILMFFVLIITSKDSIVKITLIDIFIGVVFILYAFRLSIINLGSVSLFCLYPVYLVFRFGKINYYILYYVILLATFILSTIGYLQWAEIIELVDNKYPITGFYYNSTIYGGILCFLLSVLFSTGILYSKNKIPNYTRYVFIFVILYSLPPLIISNSRSSWLALCAAVAFILYKQYRNFITQLTFWKKIWLALFIIVSMSFSGYFLYQLKSDSVKGRMLIWKITVEMIKDKPLSGFGENGFSANYMHYQANYLKENSSEKEKQLAGNNHLVFNEPLRIMVEYGIMGIILYLILIYLIFFRNKRLDKISLIAKSFVLTTIIWGLFSYPNQIFPALLYVTIALAILSKRDRNRGFTVCFSPLLFKNIKGIHLIASVILILFLISQHSAYYRFGYILQNKEKVNKENLLKQFSTLESKLSNDVGYVASYTILLFEEKQDSTFMQQLLHWEKLYPVNELYILKGDYFNRCGNYRLAEENYWLAHCMAPARQRARVKLAFLYKETGQAELARQLAHEVLNEKVKVFGFETYRLHQQLKNLLDSDQ